MALYGLVIYRIKSKLERVSELTLNSQLSTRNCTSRWDIFELSEAEQLMEGAPPAVVSEIRCVLILKNNDELPPHILPTGMHVHKPGYLLTVVCLKWQNNYLTTTLAP